MKLQRNEDVILEIFGCFGGIVLERIDFDDCDNYTDKGEAVADALDCELVYYNQQWGNYATLSKPRKRKSARSDWNVFLTTFAIALTKFDD